MTNLGVGCFTVLGILCGIFWCLIGLMLGAAVTPLVVLAGAAAGGILMFFIGMSWRIREL